eukprot:944135-Rhodomonas_salina.6
MFRTTKLAGLVIVLGLMTSPWHSCLAQETYQVKATYSLSCAQCVDFARSLSVKTEPGGLAAGRDSGCTGVALQVAALSSRQFTSDGCATSSCGAYTPSDGLYLRFGPLSFRLTPSSLASLAVLLLSVFLFFFFLLLAFSLSSPQRIQI